MAIMPTRCYVVPADVEQRVLDNIALRLSAADATAHMLTIEHEYVLKVSYPGGALRTGDLDGVVQSAIPEARSIETA